MNISHAGMAQPSFKGWIFDGKTAINDKAVAVIECASPSSYATMHLVNGRKVESKSNARQLMSELSMAESMGVRKVPEYSFIA